MNVVCVGHVAKTVSNPPLGFSESIVLDEVVNWLRCSSCNAKSMGLSLTLCVRTLSKTVTHILSYGHLHFYLWKEKNIECSCNVMKCG